MSGGEAMGWVIATAAALGAVGWLAKLAVRLVNAWEAVSRIVSRELGHNGGSSMKDDVHGTAISVQHLAERVEALEYTLGNLAESNHHIWPAIQAVAEARPPEENK